MHDWANPENTRRSWDMVARYVIPEINGYITRLRKSQKFLVENRAVFERAGQAVMAKIMENEKAAAALPLTGPGRVAIPTINAPDLQKEAGEAQGVIRSADKRRRVNQYTAAEGRHCEPPGRANARPMTGSAKQSTKYHTLRHSGAARRAEPGIH